MKNSKTGVRYVKSDEINYPKNTQVDGDIVWVTHTTTTAEGKVYVRTGIDLSNLNEDRIKIGSAYQELIQTIRPRYFRQLRTQEAIDTDGKVLDPTDYPAEGRSKKTELEKAKDTLSKLSRHEFVNMMIEEYGMDRGSAEELWVRKYGS